MGEFDYLPETVKDELKDLFLDQLSSGSLGVEREKWEHFTPVFLDTQSQGFDIKDATDALSQRQILYQKEKIGQAEGNAMIDSHGMPITVFMIGDIHWGSIFSNQELWEYHKEKVLETPGAYMMFYHNLVDNAIPGKFPSNTLNNGVPPDIQFKVMQRWVKELDEEGKVLAAIEGDCHEGWSWQVAGVSASNLLYGYEKRQFPILENGGILTLSVDNQDYKIGMWHKQGPFNSRFNPEHALRQNRRLSHESVTDVEVGAHHHNATASSNWEGSRDSLRPVHYLRVGTYKGVPFFPGTKENFISDKWAVDKFGGSGQPPAPSVTFWGDTRRMDDSLDFDTGMEKHMAQRTYALIREMGLEQDFLKALGYT